MNGNARPALRRVEGPGRDVPSEIRLGQIAAIVFSGEWAEEDEIRAIVRTGQELRRATDPASPYADIGVFLISWGAEKITELRIHCGDLGIDEVQRRMEVCRRGSREWDEAAAEFQSLADEILIDTLSEFREFDLVLLYSGQGDGYARRRSAGMEQLAQLSAFEAPAHFVYKPSLFSPESLAMAG